jgi:transcriptional regulator with XRE-family HTH domain
VELSGDSIRVARVFRGLTQRELAERVAASEATIWQVERGRTPKDSLLDALCVVLGFDREFFFERLVDEFTESDCNFRRSAAAEKLRKRVLAHGTLFGVVVSHLQTLVTLPKYRVPSIPATSLEDVEIAAERCRAELGLGARAPIVHMGRVLEHAGVVLTFLHHGSE